MKINQLKDSIKYDGSQIEPMWAFQNLNIKGSSIITWIGPMNIKKDEIIDYEDVGLEIKADEMLHFIIEHYDCQPADLRLCYHRQRIFVTIVKDALESRDLNIQRKGDDLFINEGKLSVSIATCSTSSMKIHFGINIKTKGTPSNIQTAGLMDGIKDLDHTLIREMAQIICEAYKNEIISIEDDISKTRVF
ncbi:MAG TPA: DUF366 family protein [Methanobacteriaceae archaeon]|nr:DUF366 family protein [Methanobacteriaceae archaeon]